MKEFQGMNPREVVLLIEGTPLISMVPVEPGQTNQMTDEDGAQIIGLNTEDSEWKEGMIRFDIIFYVRMKEGRSQIIINLEAQKSEPTKYDMINRAIYYISRLISSQKEREFKGSQYDDIKRAYSIWICMDTDQNCMNHIHLVNDNLIGNHEWKGDLELLNIVMIGLTGELPDKDERYELHRLLNVLLSSKIEVEEKLNILETEYQIPVEGNVRRDIEDMCNWSYGIEEKALEAGLEAGRREGLEAGRREGLETGRQEGKAEIVLHIYRKGYPVEAISDMTGMSNVEVEKILEEALALT